MCVNKHYQSHLLQWLYVIRVGGIQSGLSVECIFMTCIYIRSKFGSYNAQFWDGLHLWLIGFQICMYPGFLLQTNLVKLSFLHKVCSKSITALPDY